jgi:RNA polymerase sigma-70 factor (ECF subfamily)
MTAAMISLLARIDSPGNHSHELCLPSNVAGREGQRALKLETRLVQLFDELREPVFRYLIFLRIHPEEVEEIVQEIFLRLFEHLHAGGQEENLRGWVFRVAHNIVADQHRSRTHFVFPNPEQWSDLNESRTDQSPNPEEILLLKEKMVRVHGAFSQLTNRQQECLQLRFEGFRYREIAEILGISIPSVEGALQRAIDRLTGESDE